MKNVVDKCTNIEYNSNCNISREAEKTGSMTPSNLTRIYNLRF